MSAASSDGARALWASAMLHLPLGALLCSGRGELVQANRRAVEMLAAGDGLRVVDGMVRVSHHRDLGPFERVLGRVHRAASHGSDLGLHRLLLRGAHRNRQVQAGLVAVPGLRVALQVDEVAADGTTVEGPANLPGLVVVFLGPLGPIEQVSATTIGRLFGFTAAEARAIEALCRGLSVAEYAREGGLSPHTVRNQLKAALAKSGTRRQAELVRVVLAHLFGSDL